MKQTFFSPKHEGKYYLDKQKNWGGGGWEKGEMTKIVLRIQGDLVGSPWGTLECKC